MTTNQQFLQILERLLEKSKQNRVYWHESKSPDDSMVFTVDTTHNTKIAVSYYSPPSAPDCAGASLIVDGRTVINFDAEDGQKEYGLLRALFDEAFRSTTKWDEALKDVEKALAGDDPVGAPF